MPERWVVLPEGAPPDAQASYSQILVVHAALLHTGKVLMFGGSEHVIVAGMRSIDVARIDNTRLWDPVTGEVTTVRSPQPPPDHLYDLFCCGHAMLADGRLLVGGGTSAYPPAMREIITTSTIGAAAAVRCSTRRPARGAPPEK